MMEIDKSAQGTLEEQIFYNRRTLKDITEMRHDNPSNQDFVFTSKARIDDIQENVKWWYMSCKVCNKIVTKKADKYHCNNCNKYPESTTPLYRIRLQISDHTATTTCTSFDDEAKGMLNISASSLLDSLDGKSEEVPKIIQKLCGKTLIFRFKLKNENFTEGKLNYAVRKTFVPDDNLEMQYLHGKAEEEKNSNGSPTKEESSPMVQVKEEPKDINESMLNQEANEDKISLPTELNCDNQKRRRFIVLEDDSEVECVEISILERSDPKVYKKRKRADAKLKKTGLEDEDSDVDFAKRKSTVITAIRTAKRLTKKMMAQRQKVLMQNAIRHIVSWKIKYAKQDLREQGK